MTGFLLALREWAMPLALALSGFAIGFIVERAGLERLARSRRIGESAGMRALLGAARWMVTLAAGIIGLALAVSITERNSRLFYFLQDVLPVVAIFAATVFLARLVGRLIVALARQSDDRLPGTSLFSNIAMALVFVLGMLVILQSLGVSITPMLTALGVGGLAVALAMQDTLSNLFAGVHVIASRQVRPGDYVKLSSGEEGYVTDIGWRNTEIRTLDNNMVVVPNARLASTVLVNYFRPELEMSLLVPVRVGYGCDLDHVERVTVEVARSVLHDSVGGARLFDPFIRYHTFADSSINFTVILRVREFVDQHLVKHEFVKELHRRYRTEGIEIPYPASNVYVDGRREADGAQPAPAAGLLY